MTADENDPDFAVRLRSDIEVLEHAAPANGLRAGDQVAWIHEDGDETWTVIVSKVGAHLSADKADELISAGKARVLRFGDSAAGPLRLAHLRGDLEQFPRIDGADVQSGDTIAGIAFDAVAVSQIVVKHHAPSPPSAPGFHFHLVHRDVENTQESS